MANELGQPVVGAHGLHPEPHALAQRFATYAERFQAFHPFSARVLLRFDEVPLLLHIVDGRIARVQTSFAPLTSWDFGFTASSDTWCRFWQHMPAAGWHDVFALTKRGAMRIDGPLQPLMAHLQDVKDLLAIARLEAAR